MTPFIEKPPDPQATQLDRARLLARPAEFYRPYCQGRVPNDLEKMHFVEKVLQATFAPKTFVNDLYLVLVHKEQRIVHLTISRLDEKPCDNWQHFQQIKNELVGKECEAVELYPAD